MVTQSLTRHVQNDQIICPSLSLYKIPCPMSYVLCPMSQSSGNIAILVRPYVLHVLNVLIHIHTVKITLLSQSNHCPMSLDNKDTTGHLLNIAYITNHLVSWCPSVLLSQLFQIDQIQTQISFQCNSSSENSRRLFQVQENRLQ